METSNSIPDGEYPNRVPRDVVVSVYMITYNHAEYISQAIESVLMQKTDFPFELCIGEDRSTDATRKICISYAQRFPEKIRLFLRSEKNKADGAAYPPGRWNGKLTRDACRGEYVAIVEGDDFWIDPLKLQKQVRFLSENKNCPVCATRALVLRAEGSTINPPLKLTRIDLGYLLRGWVGVNTVTLMYRRKLLLEHAEWTMKLVSGDWCLMVRLLSGGAYCDILPDVTAVYRVHSGGVWQGKRKTKQERASHVIEKLSAYRLAASPAMLPVIDREIRLQEAIAVFGEAKGLYKLIVTIKEVACCRGFAGFLGKLIKKRFHKMVCPSCQI